MGLGEKWEVEELELHTLGQLKLDELVTREYTLDEVNQGYEDMFAVRNLRALIRF